MTFDQWLRLQKGKITLRPWQKEAAVAFLTHVEKQQTVASGKTFLLDMLSQFIEEHGNTFVLEADRKELHTTQFKKPILLKDHQKPSEIDLLLTNVKKHLYAQIEYMRISAQLTRTKFLALKENGFTDQEALELSKKL